jgi:hypothetical protein
MSAATGWTMNRNVAIRHVRDVDIIPELVGVLKKSGVEPTIERYDEEGFVNSIEWATPANVAIFISAAFMSGFLNKLGSKSAEALISAIKAQIAKAKQSSRRILSAQEIEESINNPSITGGRQPPALEIGINFEEPQTICLVFPASVNDQDVEKAFELLHEKPTEILSSTHARMS